MAKANARDSLAVWSVRWLALALVLLASTAHAQTPVYRATLHGELLVTGNTLGLDAQLDNTGSARPGTSGGIGAFIANPLRWGSDQAGSFPLGTTDQWEHDGSSAILNLADGVAVDRAELVWACSYQVAGQPAAPTAPASVTLTRPDGSDAIVAPDAEDTALTLYDAIYRYYQRWADVTALVADGGPGLYTVSGVVGTARATSNYLTACGWTLFVVTRSPELPVRNINLWITPNEIRISGKNGAGQSCPCAVQVDLDGFCTPAAPALASGRLLVSAMEGDARFVGDTLSLADPHGGGTFLALAGPSNARDNFFASQLDDSDGVLDVRSTFGAANHQVGLADGQPTLVAGARQGWDIAAVPLGDETYNPGVLANDQSATSILVATTPGGDDYILSAVGMELDVASPQIVASHTVQRAASGAEDTITATVTLTNVGSAPADDLAFCYDLPSNLTLVELSVDGSVRPGVTAADLAPALCQAPTGGLMLGPLAPGAHHVVVLTLHLDTVSPWKFAVDHVAVTESWRTEWLPDCHGATREVDPQTGTRHEVLAPLLEVTLAVSPLSAPPGAILSYVATIKNVGTVRAIGARFLASVPSATRYVPGSTTLNGAPVADSDTGMPFIPSRAVNGPDALDGIVEVGATAVVRYDVRIADANAGASAGQVVAAIVSADPDGSGPLPAVASAPASATLGTPEAAIAARAKDGCDGCAGGGVDALGLAFGLLAALRLLLRARTSP